jgi:Fic family protein
MMKNEMVVFKGDGSNETSPVQERPSGARAHYVPTAKARSLLQHHIGRNPGRFTVVDLVGITGVSANRIHRLLSEDALFIKLAKAGAVARPARGVPPKWSNSKTPVVTQSFYKGAYLTSNFNLMGDTSATRLGQRIDKLAMEALLTCNRAPQSIIDMQERLRESITAQTEQLSTEIRRAQKAEAALLERQNTTQELLAQNDRLISKVKEIDAREKDLLPKLSNGDLG